VAHIWNFDINLPLIIRGSISPIATARPTTAAKTAEETARNHHQSSTREKQGKLVN
jgi:hypothetical protein